ncbi:MAG: LysR family transcriptional regulator [Clostridia bacterium]|nr:LysR family transcriptional regulator [Clostridia bacterium]
MELTQLRYFLSVAESQHMTRSAEQLHIAQPALSKAIRQLEEELDVPLFERRGRNIVLTTCGRHFAERLAPFLSELEQIPHDLKRLAHQEEETVRINVLSASMPVAEAIIAYRRLHPQVHFHLTQNEEGVYDIGVTTRLSAGHHEGLRYVLEEEIFLAVPDEERYRGVKAIPLSEMKDRGFISLLGSRQLRVICDRFCRQAGFTPHTVFESDNPATVKTMIEAGLGVGFWPAYAWGDPPKGRIRLLHAEAPSCRRELLFSLKSGGCNQARAEDFLAFLLAELEKKA